MPIKFGDLIENANSSYAVIDLTDNQSRGVAFIDTVGTLTASISTNIQNITSDKRRQGMFLVVKDTAEVYILEGVGTGSNGTYTDAEFGVAPGEDGSLWKAIGSLELQTEDIGVNIDDAYANNGTGSTPNVGKTFGKYHPGFSQVIGSQGTQTGKVPVAAWMLEKAANPGYGVIASSQGATSLEIIRDALNELFQLQPNIAASGSIEFNQPSGSITLSASCDNVNETTCTSFVFYAREIGSATWGSPISTQPGASISGGQNVNTATWSTSFTFNWSDQENQFENFEGYEFKVVVTDGLTATGEDTDSVARGPYSVPLISSWSVTRQKNNTLYNGTNVANDNDSSESDTFRVLGNIDSDISFTITPSSLNDDSITSASHTWYLLRKSVGEGSFSNWVQIKSGSFTLSGSTSVNINTTDEGESSLSLLTNKLQYAVVVSDLFTQNQAFSINNHLSDNSVNDYWGNVDYAIYGSSTSGVGASFSGTPSGSSYSGNLSPQIRFVAPWFTGYIPESSFGANYATIQSVTSTQRDNIQDYQFGTGADIWTDVNAHEESPLLPLGTVVPPIGNGTPGGAFQIGSWAVTANARFYLMGVKQSLDATSGYSTSPNTSSFTNYASNNPSADFDLGIGHTSPGGEVYIGSNSTNQNGSLIANYMDVNIVGRADASGAAIANRTITAQYYNLLVGDQTSSVNGAVKIAK